MSQTTYVTMFVWTFFWPFFELREKERWKKDNSPLRDLLGFATGKSVGWTTTLIEFLYFINFSEQSQNKKGSLITQKRCLIPLAIAVSTIVGIAIGISITYACPGHPNKAFLEAAEKGDVTRARKLIQKHSDWSWTFRELQVECVESIWGMHSDMWRGLSTPISLCGTKCIERWIIMQRTLGWIPVLWYSCLRKQEWKSK